MASRIPKEVKREIVDEWVAETTWKVALFTSTSNCNDNGISTYAACTNEVIGTGYTAGGATIAGRVAAYIDTTNTNIDATDVTWTTATIAGIWYAVVYETTGGLIRAVYDLGATYSVTNGQFTLSWNASGLFKVK